MGQNKRRASFKVRGKVEFFDSGDRDVKLSQLGGPLEELNAHIDWEIFCADLAKIYATECKSAAGGKPIDVVLMFKIVILQRLYNLSDDKTEFQIRDRASFQRLLGLHVEDGSPDSKTRCTFKERVEEIEVTDVLFARFDGELSAQGLSATDGQKDLDACLTKKRGETYYGYKNHVNVDQEYELVRSHEVIDASVLDNQVRDVVLDVEAKGRALYADSAYRSGEREGSLSEHGLESRICNDRVAIAR